MYRNPLQVLSTLLFIAAPLAASTFSATSGSANITNTYGGPESITFTLTGPQLTSTTSSSWTPGYNALETLNNSFSFSFIGLQMSARNGAKLCVSYIWKVNFGGSVAQGGPRGIGFDNSVVRGGRIGTSLLIEKQRERKDGLERRELMGLGSRFSIADRRSARVLRT